MVFQKYCGDEWSRNVKRRQNEDEAKRRQLDYEAEMRAIEIRYRQPHGGYNVIIADVD